MRIIVNDIAASSGGAKTVLNDFYQYLVKSNDQNEWIFLLGDMDLNETEQIKVIKLPNVKNHKIKKLWFDFVSGKKFIEKLKPDVVFSLQNIITFGLKCPQVVYVHQPLPFQNIKRFSFLNKTERAYAIYQYLIGWIIKQSIKKADLTIVQTDWMRKSVIQKCNIEDKRVVQIKPNINIDLFNKTIDVDNDEAIEFFYPTSSALYKNNELIIDAAEILDKRDLNYQCSLTIKGECTRSKNVSFVGRIPYEKVIEKYYTSCLVFPSYIETFGYPLIEAREAGAIILASDCEFSRELLEGYDNAYFFNPFVVEELVCLMEKVIVGKIKKQKVESKVNKNVNSWNDVVNELIKVRKSKE